MFKRFRLTACVLTALAVLFSVSPARADNIYQNVAQTIGFNQAVTATLTQFIAAPPIITQSIRILSIQEMTADSATGGPVELEYGTGVNCGTNTKLFALVSTSTATVVSTINALSAFGNKSGCLSSVIPAGNRP